MPEVATLSSLKRLVQLPRSFYYDPPDQVARGLLGKLLVRPEAGEEARGRANAGGNHWALAGRIVEAEAYFGITDPAAHASAGKTERNFVLFGPPGHAYVYFIYGMYFCVNVSCQEEGIAGCVLLRALEPVVGLDIMGRLRTSRKGVLSERVAARPASGPGCLCQALGITRAAFNNVDFTSAHSPLQIWDDGFRPGEIVVTPRIGVHKDADRPARFLIGENPYVSVRPRRPRKTMPCPEAR